MQLTSSPNFIFRAAAASPPSSAQEGDLWYQTDTNKMFSYNGATWDDMSVTAQFATNDLVLVKKIVLLSNEWETTSGSYTDAVVQSSEQTKLYNAANTWTAPSGWNTVQKFYAIVGSTGSSSTGYAQLYNKTDSAAVASSELTGGNTGVVQCEYKESGELTITDAKYHCVQGKMIGSQTTRILEAGINVYIKKT
jgi:hypothetical protein